MPTCDDLRLGGTLSGSGITGGTTINGTALAVDDWSGIFGHAGISFTPVEVSGRPGSYLVGDGLGRARFPILNMRVDPLGPAGILTAPDACEQIWDNTDIFLALLANPAGQYLEVDLPDTTKRFIQVFALESAVVSQPVKVRRISVPLISPNPYWRAGGTQSTDTISGADTIVAAGTVNVYDPVFVFSSNGTFTHSGLGWTLTITGAVSAVTVDVGARTVKQAGINRDDLLTVNNSKWAWLTPGNNSVTSSVSTVVTWRNSFN